MLRFDLLTAYRWPFRKQMVIYLSTVFLTIFLGYLLDISDSVVKLRQVSAQEAEMKAVLISTMGQVAKGENEVSEMPYLQKHLAEWQRRLISASDISALLGEILRIGTNNSLYFGLFDPGEGAVAGENNIPLHLVATGNYQAIATFLSKIAGFSSLIKISQFSLSTEGRPEVIGQKLYDQAKQKKLLTATVFMKIGIKPENKKNE